MASTMPIIASNIDVAKYSVMYVLRVSLAETSVEFNDEISDDVFWDNEMMLEFNDEISDDVFWDSALSLYAVSNWLLAWELIPSLCIAVTLRVCVPSGYDDALRLNEYVPGAEKLFTSDPSTYTLMAVISCPVTVNSTGTVLVYETSF